MPQGPPGLAPFVKRVIGQVGTARAVAAAIGLSEGRLGRVTRGEGSMEIANLLRLAELAGEQPTAVLRLAGKAEEAELIERIYGVGAPPLSKTQRELLQAWDRLTDHAREHFRALMRDVERRGPAAAEPSRKRRVG